MWLVRSQKALCVLMGCIVLDACATPPSVDGLEPVEQVNDPLEPANREIYAFNTKARHVLSPMVEQAGVLGPLWHGVHNVLVKS